MIFKIIITLLENNDQLSITNYQLPITNYKFIFMCKLCALSMRFQQRNKVNYSLSDTSKLSALVKRKIEAQTAKDN